MLPFWLSDNKKIMIRYDDVRFCFPAPLRQDWVIVKINGGELELNKHAFDNFINAMVAYYSGDQYKQSQYEQLENESVKKAEDAQKIKKTM